jgi:hypothetical protein
VLTLPLIRIITTSAHAILDGEQVEMPEEIAPNASAITSWRGLITQCEMEGGTGTQNVPTKEHVIERVDNASAFSDTKARPAGANPVRVIVLDTVPVST